MARIGCGASLITGLGADDATYLQVSVVHAARSFHGHASARSSYSYFDRSRGVIPRIRDTFASDRRLAGARIGIDLRGGRGNDAGGGLPFVQTYGG